MWIIVGWIWRISALLLLARNWSRLKRKSVDINTVSSVHCQWRRRDTGARAPLHFQLFYFSLLWSKPESQLSQQLTALSISTALVTKLFISHEAAAAPGPKFAVWVPHEQIYSFAPPRNKSWRRHCPLSMSTAICVKFVWCVYTQQRFSERFLPTDDSEIASWLCSANSRGT